MSYNKVIIYDYQYLLKLNDALTCCGNEILELVDAINNYLQNYQEAMNKQLEDLLQQLAQAEKILTEAEQELNEAESQLSSCIASQREYEDEDGDKYTSPSCNSESAYVNSAQAHKNKCQQVRDECKQKVDQAQEIISDCNREIYEYKYFAWLIGSHGGEHTLRRLGQEHTQGAQYKMERILEKIEIYLGRPLRNEMQTGIEELKEEEANIEVDIPASKVELFKDATEKLQVIQENSIRNYIQPNADMLCSNCKRPKPICNC